MAARVGLGLSWLPLLLPALLLLALALGFAGYLSPGMVLQFASQVGLC